MQNGWMLEPNFTESSTQEPQVASRSAPLASLLATPTWQCERPVALLPHVLRLTAPNPGLMTGPGTNSYLVGEAATGYLVIDPGPNEPAHIERLWQAAGGDIRLIVCTHSHADHAPAARPLQALCAQRAPQSVPPILGLPSAATARPNSHFVPDRQLRNGESVQLQSSDQVRHALDIIHTPGHAANHLCLLLPADGLLFSGDHILNGSTTVIDPPDGHMSDYLDSLDALHAACARHQLQFILPAHGHVISDARLAISRLKAHRLQREDKIRRVMQAQPQGTLDDWLPLAYDDVPPGVWPVARRSLLAHVQRLQSLAAGKAP